MTDSRITILFLLLIPCLLFRAIPAEAQIESEEQETLINRIPPMIRDSMDEEELARFAETLQKLNLDISVLDSLFNQMSLSKDLVISDQGITLDGNRILPVTPPPVIPEKTQQQGIVKFADNVLIGRKDLIEGNVIIFGGDAVIYGAVQGGIVVLAGDVRLFSTAFVRDDVICIWGKIDADPGARIAGKTYVFNFGKFFKDTFSAGALSIAFYIFHGIVLFFALILYTAFPTHTARIKSRLEHDYLKSMATGFIGLFLLPVAVIILLATILGIPIALIVLPLATMIGFLWGMTAFSIILGERILKKTPFSGNAPAAILTGFILLELPSLLSKITLLLSSALSTVFVFAGLVVFIAISIPGLGSVLVTRFGTRD
jgi:hypothetical protein